MADEKNLAAPAAPAPTGEKVYYGGSETPEPVSMCNCQAGDCDGSCAPYIGPAPAAQACRACADTGEIRDMNGESRGYCWCGARSETSEAAPAAQAATEPPLLGHWHGGNGVLCCGTLRVFSEDFDTDPADEFKQEIMQWVCDTLNAALQHQSGEAGADALDPVEGDVLPPIGSRVSIHLASVDAWQECTVVGYYVWPSHEGNQRLHRVNVRVRMDDGTLNARMLCDIRAAMADQAQKGGE